MGKQRPHRSARSRFLSGPTYRLIIVFLLFILLPGSFLGVYSLRALQQEGRLAGQRIRDRLENIISSIGEYLDAEFYKWQDVPVLFSKDKVFDSSACPEIIRIALEEPGGGVFVARSSTGIETYPRNGLLYRLEDVPVPQIESDKLPSLFKEAENLEIRRKNYAQAIHLYRRLLDSASADLRPTILHRLARVLRKAGRFEDAADTYRDLEKTGPVWIGGLPSDLIARYELSFLAKENNDMVGLQSSSMAFYRDLSGGKWLLEKSRYLFYSEICRSWCHESGAAETEFNGLLQNEMRKVKLSQAVEALLIEPERVLPGKSGNHLAFWKTGPLSALVISTEFLGLEWWPKIVSNKGEEIDAALYTSDGQVLFGISPEDMPPFSVTRDIRAGERPWLLQVWPRNPDAISTEIRQRQRLSFTVLIFVGVLLLFGGYSTFRITRREMEIARLQADFVSTVSHEFRSPLTGIHHLAEMLLEERTKDKEKQRGYFQMILQESSRLARLTDNILDFSRMEEGRREYRFEHLSPTLLLQTLVADFNSEIAATGFVVKADIPERLPPLFADGQALATAVRNLLDNAIKYSPGEKIVWLDARADEKMISISVRDKGIGISEQNQKHIFDRFFRVKGEISKRVKGAGLGLSLVHHIAKAHGGRIECQSQSGEGSTFTLYLPVSSPSDGGKK